MPSRIQRTQFHCRKLDGTVVAVASTPIKVYSLVSNADLVLTPAPSTDINGFFPETVVADPAGSVMILRCENFQGMAGCMGVITVT